MDSTLFVDTGVSASASASTAYTLTATGKYTDPVKGTTKKQQKGDTEEQLTPRFVRLSMARQDYFYGTRSYGILRKPPRRISPSIQSLQSNATWTVAVKGGSTSTETVAYCPPMITSAVDTSGNQLLSITTGLKFHLYGSYFGSKAPSVWLEYTKNGKVVRAEPEGRSKLLCLLPTPRAKPTTAAWDIATGNSALVLIAPSFLAPKAGTPPPPTT